MNVRLPSHVARFPQAASQAVDTVGQEAVRFGELAKAWWQRNADLARETASTVRDEASALGTRSRLYVKDEPVKSVLIAAGVGAALMALLLLLSKRER